MKTKINKLILTKFYKIHYKQRLFSSLCYINSFGENVFYKKIIKEETHFVRKKECIPFHIIEVGNAIEHKCMIHIETDKGHYFYNDTDVFKYNEENPFIQDALVIHKSRFRFIPKKSEAQKYVNYIITNRAKELSKEIKNPQVFCLNKREFIWDITHGKMVHHEDVFEFNEIQDIYDNLFPIEKEIKTENKTPTQGDLFV